jgi:predicted dehydrogenase
VHDLRVGIIGYGLAGHAFHGAVIGRVPGLRVAAVVTRDPARRARAEQEHPGVRVVDAPAALWEGPDAVDLVVVASPNPLHAAQAAAALDAGRHVVVDKPVTVTSAEARDLAERAARRGVRCIPYHNRRWDGDFRTLRALVADGALGDLARLESRFERWRPVPKGGWKEEGHAGTGILYDLGPHLVDQALVLCGPVEQVYAERVRRRAGMRVDDDAFVALTHAGGARSHLWMSAVAADQGPRFRALGSAGAFVKHGLDEQEGRLLAGMRPGDAGWGAEAEARWGTRTDGAAAARVPTLPGAYEAYYAAVRDAVRDGAPDPVTMADAIAGLEILEAAATSADAGRVVRLATAGAGRGA